MQNRLLVSTPTPQPLLPFIWLSDIRSWMTMPEASSPPSTTPITIALAVPPTSGPPVIYYITADGSYSPGMKLDWHVHIIATRQDTVIHTEDTQWFSWTSSADPSADPNLSRGQYLMNMAYL